MNKPATIDPLANRVLEILSGNSGASDIILGGYFALQHYAGYRHTHYIDAWWRHRASPAGIEAIRDAMRAVADSQGFELRERQFGETLSFELLKDGRKQFSFQIALRSIPLEEPQASEWPPILIETLADNIGSKMNALVHRGSPRDFTDIHYVVARGLMTITDCWCLWARKNPGEEVDAARQKVLLHLSALEGRRPLDAISDAAERDQARLVRAWFKSQFLMH